MLTMLATREAPAAERIPVKNFQDSTQGPEWSENKLQQPARPLVIMSGNSGAPSKPFRSTVHSYDI